jgi:molybdopterin-containing oxidoreductase family iron-sulfur binding subunit
MSNAGGRRGDGKPIGRRAFLGAAAGLAAGALVPGRAHAASMEEFFQRHLLEMTPAELEAALKRLERRYRERYGRQVRVGATPPLPGVVYGYGLDLSRCVGCRRCEWACVRENNISRGNGQGHWIRVLRLRKGNLVKLDEADHHYDPPLVPEEGYFYMPVQCQHCANPPCVRACPVKATWREPDGLVVVDYDWCIGCRFCIAACPYRGRTFNWTDPVIPADGLNTDTHYLGNRPRMRAVADKCTFCIQRVRGAAGAGRYPACVEACPVGARKFGNLLDPGSEIRYIIENKRVFRLKEDLNTEPNFYYFFSL